MMDTILIGTRNTNGVIKRPVAALEHSLVFSLVITLATAVTLDTECEIHSGAV